MFYKSREKGLRKIPEKKTPAVRARCIARWSLAFVLLLFLTLAWRLGQIQYLGQQKAVTRAEKVMAGSMLVKSRRGTILDRKGRELAVSVYSEACAMDPALVDDLPLVIHTLKGALNLSDKEVELINKRAQRRGRRFVWIRRRLTSVESSILRELQLKGVIVAPAATRRYPNGKVACHLVGFTNIDGQGLEGVEKSWQKVLKSNNGRRFVLRDARRSVIQVTDNLISKPLLGSTVKLTIDLYIQHLVERELALIARKYKPLRANAVVMNPFTGDIYALANIPDFNLNRAGKVEPGKRLNSSVASIYEPGSVFKPFVLAAALNQGAVKVSTPVNCEKGSWNLGYRVLHDVHGYGRLSAGMVVVKSSNIGIAKIAKRLGAAKLYSYLRSFGFGLTTGSGLPGELPGILRPLKEWNPRFSMTSIPMGQEISVTSLQLVSAFCSLVNGGIYVQPHLIKGLLGVESGKEKRQSVMPLRRVISRKTSAAIRKILGQVVAKGTGRRARCAEYKIGGKTGTAQIAGVGGYKKDKYVATFCGFAPVEMPRLVVIVSVVEPQGAYYGGVVSAPAVKAIIRDALYYLKVQSKTERMVACNLAR